MQNHVDLNNYQFYQNNGEIIISISKMLPYSPFDTVTAFRYGLSKFHYTFDNMKMN